MNRQITYKTASVLFLVLLFPSLIWAQMGHITGRVVAEDTGEGLPGAHVEVMGSNLQIKKAVITDKEGHYTVDKLAVGTYSVKATFVGYKTGSVEDVGVLDGQSVTTDFRLLPNPYEMEQIVVSASRRAENIVDAPVSVVKVDREEIQNNTMATSLGSLMHNVKGMDYTQTGVFTESFNARGFNSAFNTRMLMVVDGVPATIPSALTTGIPIPQGDIQDVEVIVGPSAALYGPDAVSGIVSITTTDPREDSGTRVGIAGGSRSIFKSKIRHANVNGKWGWKFAGEYQRGKDYENVMTFYNADSSVAVTDDPDFEATVLRGNYGLFYYPNAGAKMRYAGGWSRYDVIDMLDTGRSQRVGPTIFYQQLTYTYQKFYLNFYLNRIEAKKNHTLHGKARNILAGNSLQEAIQKASFSSRQLNLNAEARYRIQLGKTAFDFGADFRRNKALQASQIIEGGLFSINQIGFYAHSEAKVHEKLNLVLAARQDYHQEYDAQFSPKVGVIFKPTPLSAFRFTFNRAFRSPSVVHQRLALEIGPNIFARGGRKGFRFGTADGSPVPQTFSESIAPIKPEKNTTLEVGYKGVFENRVYLDITGYRSRYKEFISPLTRIGDSANGVYVLDDSGNPRVGETTFTYLNFGRQTVLGLDVGLQVYATDRTVLKGNVSVIEAQDLDAPIGFQQPFNTSPMKISLGLLTRDFGTRGTFLDLSLRYVREYDMRTAAHVGTIPTYTVLDANMGFRTQTGLIYKFTVKNMLNNKHIEFVDGAKLGAIAVGEIEYGF